MTTVQAVDASSSPRSADSSGAPSGTVSDRLRSLWHHLRARRIHQIGSIDSEVGGSAAAALVERAVRQSSPVYASVIVTQREVAIDDLHPLSRVVDMRRLEVARSTIRLTTQAPLRLFTACWVRRRGETGYRVVIPPVVEDYGDGFAVVDGVHRLYAAHTLGVTNVSVVVIAGHELPPLAGIPFQWDDVRLSDKRQKYISRRDKFSALRRDTFRPTGAYFRSRLFYFTSLSALRDAADDALLHQGEPPERYWCRKHNTLDQCELVASSVSSNEDVAGRSSLARRHDESLT